MWKIAKNEFKYLLTIIYANKLYYIIAGLLFFPSLLSLLSKEVSQNSLNLLIPTFLVVLFGWLPVIYFGSLIHQYIQELSGRRLRLHSSKPVKIKSIGKARQLYPFLHWLAFALVYIILGMIISEYVNCLHKLGVDVRDYYVFDGINANRALQVSMIYLYLTYASRTLFEKGSRIIGIAFLSFLLSWYLVLEYSLPDEYSELIKSWIDYTVHPEMAIGLSLIFACATYYSFIKRRSYLA